MTALDTKFAVTAASTAAPSVTVQPPACNAGDLLVMTTIGAGAGGVAANTPSGWTRQSGGGAVLGVFTRTATSSESAYTVSFASSCAASVAVASYPAATVAATSFLSSSPSVVSYSPAFPGGVTTDQVVILAAGVVTSATGGFSASTSMEFPASWTWEVPPVGPQYLSAFPAGVTATCAVGMAAFTGPTTAPALTSVQKTQFYAGYLVLSITTPEPPWLRVTATVTSAGGANSNVGQPGAGMALTVKALSGADTPANIAAHGKTASSTASNTQLAVTPARSGSHLYGALSSANPTGAYTPAAGTTFSQNIYNTAGGVKQAYGTFGTSAAVTAGTPVTVGATGPAVSSVNIAVAEILTTSTLAETATAVTGATVAWDYPTAPAAKTAIFTALPAAGTVLVAMVSWSQGDSTTTVALTDSSGMDWTELVRANGTAAGYAGVWAAVYGVTAGPPGVPTGLQVTGVSDTTLTLSWTAPTQGPVTGYDMYVNGMANSTAATTTATVAGLSPNTTYSLAVDAFNAAGRSSQTTAVPGTTSGGPPPPPQSTGAGCLFGLRPVPSAGVSPETSFAGSVIAREVLLGRKADIITTWRNWDPATQTTTAELQCIQGGRLPLLTWPLPASVPAGANAAITAGTYDAIIYGWGQKIAALGGRVLFRPLPDANADPNFGPAPATFITSWQRIWTIIKGTPAQFAALSPACTAGPALSAANVDFVWAMAQRPTVAAGGHLWASYFPGGAYVDWIALDTYNLSPATQMIGTLITTGDFVSTGSSHNWYATYAGSQQPGGSPIPLMISETGCREADDPGVAGQPFSKATWLAQAQALLQNYPAVRAVVYTDAVLPTGDWRLDTSPGPAVIIDDPQASPTLAAAIAWAGDPYFDRRMKVLTDGAADLYLAGDPPGN